MLKFSVFFIGCLFFIYGCCGIKQTIKAVAGVSTKEVESSRKEAIAKDFNCGYTSCYNKVKSVLKKTGAYIYAEDSKKGMIALYLSEEDTTAVGVFFSQIDAANTKVEVSSPSTYAKELVWSKIISGLEKEGSGE
jgi:hypothetical protein